MIIKKIAMVKANGKRYLFLRKERNKVYCTGEVVSVSGFSCTHLPDKVFLASHVTVFETDYDEQLLADLYKQGTGHVLPPPPMLKVEEVKKTPEGEKVVARKKWAKKDKQGGRLELTEHARKQLKLEGESMALDGLGNYLKREDFETAAFDGAAYHPELTYDGAKEGYNNLRECAADYIFEGMLAGEKQWRREHRSTELP